MAAKEDTNDDRSALEIQFSYFEDNRCLSKAGSYPFVDFNRILIQYRS